MANGLTMGSGLADRTAAGPHHAAAHGPAHHGAGPAPAWCAVPRCTLRFEKCADGFKIHCDCPDQASCGTLQNLCRSLAEGMCSCACTKNGICVAQCNLCFCSCTCEPTAKGVCITCRSGDKDCCKLTQGCCECLAACCQAGCACTVCFGGVPVCCGTCAC